ncbi:MAG: sigma-70 family RNA polymerase sigma factor [bacterium]|nr:sigma-70 family RNA polymerase sigma factor [bacterium]
MASAKDRHEARLVSAARDGSESAYAALVEMHQRALFRFLLVRSACREDAEDLLQDAFLRGWSNLHLYDTTRSFSAWLYTIAARLAVSLGRRRRLGAESAQDLAAVRADSCPVEVAQQREGSENIWDLATSVLPADQRTALWLAYAEGRSAREIGEILGKRETAVRVLLFRARRVLAGHIQCGDKAVSSSCCHE